MEREELLGKPLRVETTALNVSMEDIENIWGGNQEEKEVLDHEIKLIPMGVWEDRRWKMAKEIFIKDRLEYPNAERAAEDSIRLADIFIAKFKNYD